jgi:hypothetical protein
MSRVVAACPCEYPGIRASCEEKISTWVANATGQGAELPAVREWGELELAAPVSGEVADDLWLFIGTRSARPRRSGSMPLPARLCWRRAGAPPSRLRGKGWGEDAATGAA